VVFVDGFLMEEVTDDIEDRAIEHAPPLLHRGIPDGLSDVGLARAGRPHQQRIPRLIEEATRGQVKDLTSWDRRVELPVELIEWLQVAKAGELSAALDLA